METTPEHRTPPYLSHGLSNDTSSSKAVKKAKTFIVRSRRAQTLCPYIAENITSPPKSISFKRKSTSPVIPAARVIKKHLVQTTTQTGDTLTPVQSEHIIVTENISNYENNNDYVGYRSANQRAHKNNETQTEEFDKRPPVTMIDLSDKQLGTESVEAKSSTKHPTIKKVRSRRRATTVEPTTVQDFLNIVKLIRADAVKEADRTPPAKEHVTTSPEPITVEAFKKQMAEKRAILPEYLALPTRSTLPVKEHVAASPEPITVEAFKKQMAEKRAILPEYLALPTRSTLPVKEHVAASPEPITVEAFKKQMAEKRAILPEYLALPTRSTLPVKEHVAASPEPITVEAFKKQMAKKRVILPEPLPLPTKPEHVQKHQTPKQQTAERYVDGTPQRICLVPGCPTELKLPRPPGMRYHCLPVDFRLRKEYLKVCGRNRDVSVTGFVCGKHFKRDDYEANGTLKKDALPSVNVANPTVTSIAPPTLRMPVPVRRTHIPWDELLSPSFRPPDAASDDCSNWNVSLYLEKCAQFVRLRLQPLSIGLYIVPYSVVDVIQIFRDLTVCLWTDDRLIPVDRYLNQLSQTAQGDVLTVELNKLFEFDFAGWESQSDTSPTATN